MSIGLRMAGTAQPRPIDPALVGWWKMDGNLTDSSGKGNNGTVGAGSAAYAAGKFGQAWDNDETRYVLVPETASVRGLNTVTFSAWVKLTSPTSVASRIYIESMNDKLSAHRFTIYRLTSDGKIYFQGRAEGVSADTNYGTLTATFPTGEWVHLAVVYNAPAEKATMYFNGQFDSEKTIANAGFADTAPLRVSIGQMTNDTQRWIGQIDNLMIYNRALAPAEIRYVYESGRPVLL